MQPGRIVGSLLTAALLLFAQPAARAGTPIAPLTQRIVQSIFADGLIAQFDEYDVKAVALQYTLGTRYAGQVFINESPERDGLNIYIIHVGTDMPFARLLAGSCRAFATEAIIICDRDYLASMPRFVTVLKPDGAPVDPKVSWGDRPPPFLYWVLGHEIGHIVLGLNELGSASGMNRPETIDFTGDDVAVPLRSLGADEIDADRFAITGFPIKLEEEWTYFFSMIGLALDYYGSGQKVEGLFDNSHLNKSPEPIVTKEIELKIEPGDHPPLILRLYGLVAALRQTYSDLPFEYKYFAPAVFHISYVDHDDAAPMARVRNSLFFGGQFLQAEVATQDTRASLLDLAWYNQVVHGDEYASKLLRFACVDDTTTRPVLKLQRALYCHLPVNANAAQMLERCPSLGEDAMGCFSLLPAFAAMCAAGDVTVVNARCPSTEALRATFKSLLGTALTSARVGALLPVARLLSYPYLTTYPDEATFLDSWVLDTITESLIEPRSTASILLQWHRRFLADRVSSSATSSHLVNFIGKSIEKMESLEDRKTQISDLTLALNTIAKYQPNNFFALGYYELKLANAQQRYGNYSLGSSEPGTSAFYHPGIRMSQPVDTDIIRLSAPQTAVNAASYFYKALSELADANEKNKTEISRIRAYYVQSLSQALYSYNTMRKPDLSAALATSRELMEALKASPQFHKDDDFDLKVTAPAQENCAVANYQSPHGDASLAVALLEDSFHIRGRIVGEFDTRNIAWMMANAQWAIGHKAGAKVLAQILIVNFENMTHRRYPVDHAAAIIRGNVVKMKEMLEWKSPEEAP